MSETPQYYSQIIPKQPQQNTQTTPQKPSQQQQQPLDPEQEREKRAISQQIFDMFGKNPDQPIKPRKKNRTQTEKIYQNQNQCQQPIYQSSIQDNNEMDEQMLQSTLQFNNKTKYTKEDVKQIFNLSEFQQKFSQIKFKGDPAPYIKPPPLPENRFSKKFKTTNYFDGMGIIYYTKKSSQPIQNLFKQLYCKTKTIGKCRKNLHNLIEKTKQKQEENIQDQQKLQKLSIIKGLNSEKFVQAIRQLQQLLKITQSESEKSRIQTSISNLEQAKETIRNTQDETLRESHLKFLNAQIEKICQQTQNEKIEDKLLSNTIILLKDKIKFYENQIQDIMKASSAINQQEDEISKQKMIVNFNGLLRSINQDLQLPHNLKHQTTTNNQSPPVNNNKI